MRIRATIPAGRQSGNRHDSHRLRNR